MHDEPRVHPGTEQERHKATPVSVVYGSCSIVGTAGIAAEARIAYVSPATGNTLKITFACTSRA
jgi:hypothetical protein